MTPFALLQAPDELTKSAKAGLKLLRGAHDLLRNGFWKTVADKTVAGTPGWRGKLHSASKLFHNQATNKSTALAKGLNIYGMGGMAAGVAGYDLPGSQLAMNITTPGLGALFTAAPAVQSARMMSGKNRSKVMEDVQFGAREAVGDMMSLAQADPRYVSHADFYKQFMSQYSPEVSAAANKYTIGDPTNPLSRLSMLRSAFSDPQAIVNNQIDQRIPGLLAKAGAEKSAMSALRTVGTAAGHALPWLFAAGGTAALGHSIFSDKPYDETQVRQRGYAAAQAAMQKKLSTMNPIERMAVRFDPTLIGQQAEKYLPGTLSQWEQKTGQKFQPGLLSSAVDDWNKGGDNSYYEYDAAGGRRYI